MKPPVCPYCEQPAQLVHGDVIYPGRTALAGKFYWQCAPCDAWVGTHAHSASHAPLGRLANAELRAAKVRAHAAFDRLWKARQKTTGVSKSKARHLGYKWLAGQLGLTGDQCHIGMFDVAQCEQVVVVCAPYAAKAAA